MTSAMQYPAKVSFTLTFNWKITLLTLLVLPVLISLGCWQLQRAEEKRQLQAAFNALQHQTPLPLDQLKAAEFNRIPNYSPVELEGVFDNAHSWLLDNKLRVGRVGYEVVTPVLMDNGISVLVNRGWLPAPLRRSELPTIVPVEGKVRLNATVFRPTDNGLLESRAESEHWPRVIVELDNQVAAQTLQREIGALQLRLDSNSVGAFNTDWKTINVRPQKHTGYAVQWFAMALALVICFICTNTNVISVIQSRQLFKSN